MKNQNLKTNKTKLIAKLMLIVLFLVGVLTLSSCNTTQASNPFRHEYYDTFKDAEQKIRRVVEYGETFILFDLDDEEAVKKTSYMIELHSTINNKKLIYLRKSLSGCFSIIVDENINIEVCYGIMEPKMIINDDAVLDIKFDRIITNDDYRDPSKQIVSVLFAVCDGDQNIFYIEFKNSPLLEDGNYEEYYSDVCDMLLENLVVIK